MNPSLISVGIASFEGRAYIFWGGRGSSGGMSKRNSASILHFARSARHFNRSSLTRII